MWQSIDKLMGFGRHHTASDLTADEFHRFFAKKVAQVHDITANAPDPLNVPGRLSVLWATSKQSIVMRRQTDHSNT